MFYGSFVAASDDLRFWNEADERWGTLQEATRYDDADAASTHGIPLPLPWAACLVLGQVAKSLYDKGLFSPEYGAYVASAVEVPFEDIAFCAQVFAEAAEGGLSRLGRELHGVGGE